MSNIKGEGILPETVFTAYNSNNAELIENAGRLYFKDGQRIADVTYGKGVFWRKIDLSRFDFFPSDIITTPESPYDFRNLPYDDESFDHVILDPPYVHNPGKMMLDHNYQNAATTNGMYHNDIIQLYRDGMNEAYRILSKGGMLWVKGKDEVESSKQRRSCIEIFHIAVDEMGMEDQDMFIMVQLSAPLIQRPQVHARKNHSFLWIFKK